MMVRRGMIRPLEYGDVLVFAVSMSILFYYYQHEPKILGNIHGIFSTFIGREEDEQLHWFDDKISKWMTSFTGFPGKIPKPGFKIIFMTVIGFFKGFLVGFLIQTAIKIIGGVRPGELKDPKTFFKGLFSFRNNGFPLFLGMLTSLTRFLASVMRKILGRNHPVVTLAVGFISGLSILLARSTEVSMWFASKAGEALVQSAIQRKIFTPPKNAQTLLYSWATATIFYNVVFESYNIRPSVWKFLLNVTGGLMDHFPKIGEKLRKDIGIPQ